MTAAAHLCLVLHNHQPIGNFDGVFEQAYQDSYLPFLDVFEQYDRLQISLHTSGPLMMWLAERHPEYLDRVRLLVDAGRVEIVGGPQYEPILSMLPARDRRGQIRAYSNWLQRNFGVVATSMWTPERVWESSLACDVVDAGISTTVLDDFHFKAAGLTADQLTGYFLTEDQGRILKIFPGSEHLRYTIPFQPVEDTIRYCREMANRHPGIVLTFGDDGEKFGTWPDTKAHVYEGGWLHRFFTALSDNADWLQTSTLGEAVRQTPPAGKVYLPDCSYREMTQWSLPTGAQEQFDDVTHAMTDHPRWSQLQTFVRGGFWRNFKIKYAEAAEMYARMMDVSNRLLAAENNGADAGELSSIRDHLYRGQCNCPYWHGAFGGVYLPHLRNAVYSHLIQADTELDRLTGAAAVDALADDFDFDGMPEIRLSNANDCLWIAPGRGGRIYEWDVRGIAHNLLATLQRRPEAYHRKVLAGPTGSGDDAKSIHDLVVFKQDDLADHLHYDKDPRKSLMDRFYDVETSVHQVKCGEAMERGDFVNLPYEAKIRRRGGAGESGRSDGDDDRVQVQMTRRGNVMGDPVTITKAITMSTQTSLTVSYLLENIPADKPIHFAVEMNFAGLPSGAEDRYFSDVDGNQLGQLGETLDLRDASGLRLSDRWLGLDVDLQIDRPSGVWAFPVETVSLSEAGFELVHQSVCVQPHWIVQPDADGRWSVTIQLAARCQSNVPSPELVS